MNLEQNPISPAQQAELATKKKELAELETKQKELTNSLPLTTQINLLEQEIQVLTQKPTKTKTEEALLASKKKELAELLAKQSNSNTAQPSDKTALAVGCGVIGLLALLLIFILARNRKKNKKINNKNGTSARMTK